jgi:hypothetical protein
LFSHAITSAGHHSISGKYVLKSIYKIRIVELLITTLELQKIVLLNITVLQRVYLDLRESES